MFNGVKENLTDLPAGLFYAPSQSAYPPNWHIIRSRAINTAITDIKPVTDPLDRLPRILRKNPEQNLCACNEVPKIDIINAIIDGATTVEEIRKRTYATMGSGCCKQQVERLIECLCYLQPKE